MSDAGAPISPEQRESASGASAVPLHEVTESTGVQPDSKLLEDIAQRVLWLSTRIVDAANHDRATGDGVKVGGHQASSASLVTAMTALYFAHLDAPDRISVKPHASPVLHAINYLLGNLDRSYLPTLRAFGGLQSYPSRTKDPDPVDFSTGSVGLGPAAPLFAAVARRYVDAHFGARPASRFIALLGDAELDEGNIWEAIADPATQGLGNVMWIVDFNRQSLDRVVPGIRIQQWRSQFQAAGWHVVEVKYGPRLTAAYAQPGGAALEAWIDAMPNERYQSLFGLDLAGVRERFLDGAPAEVVGFSAVCRTRTSRAWSPISGVTMWRRCLRRTAPATPKPTVPVWFSPIPSRVGVCRWRATRATTPRCCRPSRWVSCARGWV